MKTSALPTLRHRAAAATERQERGARQEDERGDAGAGTYVSTMGVPNTHLPPAGRRFLRAFAEDTPSFGAAYAAQAADVLLAAIARSDGSRASVLRELYATDVRDGILGRIRFDRGGDLVSGPITILRLRRGPGADRDPQFANTVVDRVIVPPASLVTGRQTG